MHVVRKLNYSFASGCPTKSSFIKQSSVNGRRTWGCREIARAWQGALPQQVYE